MELPTDKTLENAVQSGDYAAFRKAASAYDEPIRQRVEAWAGRHPDLLAQVGGAHPPVDVFEEVFIHAFEHYGQRPPGRHLARWLDDSFEAVVGSVEQQVGARKQDVGSERTDEPRRE